MLYVYVKYMAGWFAPTRHSQWRMERLTRSHSPSLLDNLGCVRVFEAKPQIKPI